MASTVQKFFGGLVIFVTGGTGFLGKPLVLKVVQSCGIIVLLWEKRGHSWRQSLFNVLSRPVSVTCVFLPWKSHNFFFFIFRNRLR